jgi:hypothetical protein
MYRYLNVPGQWQHIGGNGADFAVSAHTVYAISPQRDEDLRYTQANNSWTSLGFLASLTSITGCP